ncbi:MAG: hypothetical protein E7515_03480 [Ruminococcaceae bacterium]|nr:hypothetical protein [Oscillospiraceae bacterium]
MKKLLAILLVAVFCLGVFTACSKKTEGPKTSEQNVTENPYAEFIETYKGDWNGCVKFTDCKDAYKDWEGSITGAIARFNIDNEGNITPFIGLNVQDTPIENLSAKFSEDGTILLSGQWIKVGFKDVVLSENNGTISTKITVENQGGAITLIFNFRRLDDTGWTDENPGFGESQINECMGKSFDELAEINGYSPSDYPAAQQAQEATSEAPKTSDSGENAAAGAIIGSWVYSGGGYTYTFNKDGTGSYTAGSTVMEFTYEDDGSTVKILYKGNTVPNEFAYTIKGKTLSIEDSFGDKVEYTKK